MTVETRSRRVQSDRSSPSPENASSDPKKDHVVPKISEAEKLERENLCLWIQPVQTLYYAFLESCNKLMILFAKCFNHRKLMFSVFISCFLYFVLSQIEGPHQRSLIYARKKLSWWLWWIGLGFLSSCGFGTGLHTFVLYLGPFIAEVTIAAHECGTAQFPEPPYPEEIVCPSGEYPRETLSIFSLIRKTQLEAILWGLGTAIGELPPYFMARSARLSGHIDEEDEELLEFEEMVNSVETHCRDMSKMSYKEWMECLLHRLIQKAGFVGILLCASIPNPLFDLAGMTCGHFLVPFWHFFGATFIGKALVKVHIQQIAIIAVTSEHYINMLLNFLGTIPRIGETLKKPLLQYIAAQKDKLHHKHADAPAGWVPWIISLLVFSLMMGFVVSIVHAFARDYHRRLCKWKHIIDGEIKSE